MTRGPRVSRDPAAHRERGVVGGDPPTTGTAELDGQALAADAVALGDRSDALVAVHAGAVQVDVVQVDGRLVRLGCGGLPTCRRELGTGAVPTVARPGPGPPLGRILTRAAAERVEAHVLSAGARVLAWNPGVLVRYGELAVVDRLRARSGLADSDLQTLWLVVCGSTVDAKPLFDGRPHRHRRPHVLLLIRGLLKSRKNMRHGSGIFQMGW